MTAHINQCLIEFAMKNKSHASIMLLSMIKRFLAEKKSVDDCNLKLETLSVFVMRLCTLFELLNYNTPVGFVYI